MIFFSRYGDRYGVKGDDTRGDRQQTAEYLAKGREIEEVPAKEVTPEHIEWMRRRGIDFTPWWSFVTSPSGASYTW